MPKQPRLLTPISAFASASRAPSVQPRSLCMGGLSTVAHHARMFRDRAARRAALHGEARTTLSPGANAGCLYGLNTQHDPRQASSLAWRIRSDAPRCAGADRSGFHQDKRNKLLAQNNNSCTRAMRLTGCGPRAAARSVGRAARPLPPALLPIGDAVLAAHLQDLSGPPTRGGKP